MPFPIATFSIAAYDPTRKEWGVAVQSKFLAVGSVVPFARASAGAIATQSYANYMYGPNGLDLCEQGISAQEVVKLLTEPDEQSHLRQFGVVDKHGNAAAFTGDGCHDWAGHITGDGFACQGNILLPGTVEAMANKFQSARKGSGELADWLVEALEAGQHAGGDSRGRQSASVLVVREKGGYGGNNDHYLDLRVDDHPTPIQQLIKLVSMHHLFFGVGDPNNLIPINDALDQILPILRKTGHYSGPDKNEFDQKIREALRALVGIENLEERWTGAEDTIDIQVLAYLTDKFRG